jgi:hypothetical protein
MIVFAHQKITAIGLLLQQECTKVGDVSIVKMMLTTAICFGLMVLIPTSANLKVLNVKVKFVI